MIRRALPFLMPALLLAQAPKIAFDATHFDFGRISPDKKVSHLYKVTNAGNAILSITNVRPACGCTSTVTGQWSVKPGESTDIEATFDPRGQRGIVRKSIVVVSNDPKAPETTLTFDAEVVQPIQPSKDNVFFDNVDRGGVTGDSIRFVSTDGNPVKLTGAEAPGAPYLHLATRSEGKDAVLDLKLAGQEIPKGQDMGIEVVTVRTANPQLPVFRVNVQWQVKPSITVEPAAIAWSEAKAGKELRMELTLAQAQGKAFRVTNASSTNPILTVEGVGAAAAAKQKLVIVFSAKARPGRYSEKATILTDDPQRPSIEIPVYAVLK
ncbi:MAG TPA: DUF1573 domain-containing protein [Holophagaceae bacterium]|nr:DUF1573 domain-containing protein [Holophagaceae bacterium]